MAERKYIRDGRAPVPVDPRISANMSRIRAKNTGPEKAMRAALSEAGIRGADVAHVAISRDPKANLLRKRGL